MKVPTVVKLTTSSNFGDAECKSAQTVLEKNSHHGHWLDFSLISEFIFFRGSTLKMQVHFTKWTKHLQVPNCDLNFNLII